MVPVAHDGKRVQYTLGQKVSYLRRMEALKYGIRQAAKTFQIKRGTLQGWKHQQLTMENQYFSMTARGYADRTKDRPLVKWAPMGAAAYAYLLEMRDNKGQAVVREDILSFCEGFSPDFDAASPECQSAFFSKWRQLYRLVYRCVSGMTQFLPANWEAVMNAYYGKMLFYKMSEFAIIIHCDETFAPYENVEKRTLEKSGAKKVRIKTTGQEKDGCTVLLGGIYVKRTGQSHRLPPLFIFKCESSGVRISRQPLSA